jgi:hypothetical protein
MLRLLRIAMVLAAVMAGLADTLTLKNGQVVTGAYLGGAARHVRMDLGGHIQAFDVSDIVRIEFSGPATQRGFAASFQRSAFSGQLLERG